MFITRVVEKVRDFIAQLLADSAGALLARIVSYRGLLVLQTAAVGVMWIFLLENVAALPLS